jgi:hypothetical protein
MTNCFKIYSLLLTTLQLHLLNAFAILIFEQYHNEHVAMELERWRTIIKEGVVFEEGSLLHTSSVSVERALQRRVAAEICNMSFIVLSASYAVVIGGHLNRNIVGFGPGEYLSEGASRNGSTCS